jgi:hypothetical protein
MHKCILLLVLRFLWVTINNKDNTRRTESMKIKSKFNFSCAHLLFRRRVALKNIYISHPLHTYFYAYLIFIFSTNVSSLE